MDWDRLNPGDLDWDRRSFLGLKFCILTEETDFESTGKVSEEFFLSSVSQFTDVGENRHPNAHNFPLLCALLGANFPLSYPL